MNALSTTNLAYACVARSAGLSTEASATSCAGARAPSTSPRSRKSEGSFKRQSNGGSMRMYAVSLRS